jgi:hypothetical protein
MKRDLWAVALGLVAASVVVWASTQSQNALEGVWRDEIAPAAGWLLQGCPNPEPVGAGWIVTR